MSLTSFIAGIEHFVARLFKKLPAEVEKAAAIGAEVTQALKTFDDNNPEVADIITTIIPGNADDIIVAAVRKALPVIITDLKLVATTAGLTDPNEIVAAGIKVLKDLDPKVSPAFLHNISIMVAQVAADGKLSWSDGVYLLEWYYKNKVKVA